MDQRSLTLRHKTCILLPGEEIMILSLSKATLLLGSLFKKKKKRHQRCILEEADLVDFLEFKVA